MWNLGYFGVPNNKKIHKKNVCLCYISIVLPAYPKYLFKEEIKLSQTHCYCAKLKSLLLSGTYIH